MVNDKTQKKFSIKQDRNKILILLGLQLHLTEN